MCRYRRIARSTARRSRTFSGDNAIIGCIPKSKNKMAPCWLRWADKSLPWNRVRVCICACGCACWCTRVQASKILSGGLHASTQVTIILAPMRHMAMALNRARKVETTTSAVRQACLVAWLPFLWRSRGEEPGSALPLEAMCISGRCDE